MSYELLIGLRYLYRGDRSPRALLGLAASGATIALAIYLLLTSDGSSPGGVILLVAGMIGTTLFALLSLFSVFTTVSVLGVVLGVAALTTVLAVTTGFQEQFREKVLGVNAHVLVMKNTADFSEYREVLETARNIDPDVLSVQPFIFVEMLVTRGQGELSGVAVKGVDPERVTDVLDLQKHMIEGDVRVLSDRPADGPAPIILGQELARKLHASVGDKVTLVAPLSNIDLESWTAKAEAPVTRDFIIRGIFYSGFDEYDRRLMYISLAEAQEILQQRDQVMGVEMKVRDVERAAIIADRLEAELGGSPYMVQDWNELNRNLFAALTLQKLVLLVILTLIIAVAAFNLISALTMMVTDKTREIAILKSMGSTSRGIGTIFLIVGTAIGAVGTTLGLTIGLVVCHVVAGYGYRLDPKVYLIDRLPIQVEPREVVLVAVITMVISFVATLLPALRASSLRPVEGLRYD